MASLFPYDSDDDFPYQADDAKSLLSPDVSLTSCTSYPQMYAKGAVVNLTPTPCDDLVSSLPFRQDLVQNSVQLGTKKVLSDKKASLHSKTKLQQNFANAPLSTPRLSVSKLDTSLPNFPFG